jgi:hypothetical protein
MAWGLRIGGIAEDLRIGPELLKLVGVNGGTALRV